MKLGLITPPQSQSLLRELHLGYHFVLAQYLSDWRYRCFYEYLHHHGHFIMLDNGAAELGQSIDATQLAELADSLDVDEVVMPDVLDNKDATLQRTSQALSLFPIRKRAMCPQGTTWYEWEQCAEEMVAIGCATLCVAKRYELLPGGRAHALELIRDNLWDRDHNIHLLGCYQYPLMEIRIAKCTLASVRSVDTGAPIAYAQANASLDDPNHYSLDWDKTLDWNLAKYNIKQLLRACGDK